MQKNLSCHCMNVLLLARDQGQCKVRHKITAAGFLEVNREENKTNVVKK